MYYAKKKKKNQTPFPKHSWSVLFRKLPCSINSTFYGTLTTASLLVPGVLFQIIFTWLPKSVLIVGGGGTVLGFELRTPLEPHPQTFLC
jgi:hypothetical protein